MIRRMLMCVSLFALLLFHRSVGFAQSDPPPTVGDTREDLEASAFLGLAIDTFAAQEIQNYLNPGDNGVTKERSVFGFDVAYRLLHGADLNSAPQLWIYGGTIHGARSEDLDCEKAPSVPSCQKSLAGFATNIPEASLYMLRNATSLEALMGLRHGFKNLNVPGGNPARLYASGQFGFVELAQSDGDAKDMHHVPLGATVVGGARQGSYLEIGFGKTDLFLKNRNRRIKIDGLLHQALGGGIGFFAELFADVDASTGPDSIQSYIGLSFDIPTLVGTLGGEK
jgi:hypothetical protein